MCRVSVEVPEEILLDLHEDKIDFAKYVKCRIALDLYKERKVSLGYCATIAGLSKEEFVKYLGENGVSIFSFEDENDFLEELKNA